MTAAVATPIAPTANWACTPYLSPVPQSEPPYDDVLIAQRQGAPVVHPAQPPHRAQLNRPNESNRPSQPNLSARSDSRPVTAQSRAASTVTTADRQTVPVSPSRPQHDPDVGTAGQRAAALRHSSTVAGGTTGTTQQVQRPTTITSPMVQRPTTITSRGVPPWSSESDIGVRRTATEQLPPVPRAASVFARALVEVLSGRRPVAQLRVHSAPEIYAGLTARPVVGSMSLPHLLTVRVCEPCDGVAEISAAFRRADRVRALAFRIEGVDGRWRITALQVG